MSYYYGLNADFMISLAAIESGNNPYAIGAKVGLKKWSLLKSALKKHRVPYATKKYKKWYLVSVKPKTESQFRQIVPYILKFAKDFDVGLFQINRANIVKYVKGGDLYQKVIYVSNIDVNFRIAKFLLKKCHQRYKAVPETLECYNKGRFKGKYDYALRFYSVYEKMFLKNNSVKKGPVYE